MVIRQRGDKALQIRHVARCVFCTHLLVLSSYLLLSIALTWPLIGDWRNSLVGSTGGFVYDGSFGDGLQNVWNMWWVRQAIERGQNPFWTDMLYYPEGVQMYLQTLNITNAILVLPVQYVFGLTAAYNAAILLAFTLTGYAGFLLTRAFVPDQRIAFLCGAMLTAGPFHLVHLEFNHLNMLSIQWLPLYFLALYGLERGGGATKRGSDGATRRRGNATWIAPRIPASSHPRRVLVPTLLAIAMFVLVTLTDWYWGLFCGIATVVWVGISLIRVTTHEREFLLWRYLSFGVGVLVCLLPLLIGIALLHEQVPTVDIRQNEIWRGYVQNFSGDALGIFFPTMYHPLWGEPMRARLQETAPGYSPSGWYIAAGWVFLGCAAVGVWTHWRTHWPLLMVGGILWLLSLGPSLRVMGIDTGIPMPYQFLQAIELLSTARKPSHFAIVTIVLATVFAGIGLQWLKQQVAPQRRSVVLLVVAALAMFELWPMVPIESQSFDRHPIFAQIRTRPGAVADLPLEWRESSRSLHNQMIHEQPVLGGYVARRPIYETFFIPHINQIGRMRHHADIVPMTHEVLAAMQCYAPVRHVVLKKDEETHGGSQRELESLLTTLNGVALPPAYTDAIYVWYELPLFPSACQPFVYLGQGWYDVEGTATAIWRWASATSDIWLVNPFETALVAHLTIAIDSFAFPRPVALWQDDLRLVQWDAGNVPRRVELMVNLPPGRQRLQLRAEPWLEQSATSERWLTVPVRQITLEHSTVLTSFGSDEE